MQVKFIEEKEKFKPIKIELIIGSIEELRLFFHIINHNNLKDLIIKDKYYNNYSENFAQSFTTNFDEFDLIQKKIKELGYEL